MTETLWKNSLIFARDVSINNVNLNVITITFPEKKEIRPLLSYWPLCQTTDNGPIAAI
jgi:hypothetical protein